MMMRNSDHNLIATGGAAILGFTGLHPMHANLQGEIPVGFMTRLKWNVFVTMIL